MSLIWALVWGHHDTAVGRVGGSAGSAMSSVQLAMPLPRAELGVAYGMADFGRVLRDGEQMSGAEVLVHTLTPSVALRLPSRTSLHLSAPLGRVMVAGQAADGPLGLGDLELLAAQELGLDHPRRALFVSAGLSAPTGRYSETAALSVTDIQDKDGAFQLTTYDTRASLGAGSFSLSASLSGRLELGPAALVGAAKLRQPVSYTPDEIFWGSDLGVQSGLVLGFGAQDRVQLGAGLSAGLHTQDRLTVDNEVSGEPELMRVGQRRELGATASVSVRVHKRVACGVQAQAPLIQQAQGVQLVQRYAVSSQCAVGRTLQSRR